MSSKKDVLGILQIINAQDQEKRIRIFSQTDEKVMLHFAGIAAVALERAQMTRSMILRMIRMAEMRDPRKPVPTSTGWPDFHWSSMNTGPNGTISTRRRLTRPGTYFAWGLCSTTWAKWRHPT